MDTIETPVLIAGGGPVGLATSIALSCHGVRSLLVERHPGTTRHPKASVVNARTMELFRQWGIEAVVRERGVPLERMANVIWATSLTGFEIGRLSLGDPERTATYLAREGGTNRYVIACLGNADAAGSDWRQGEVTATRVDAAADEIDGSSADEP